jgi:hypothetical protein
MTPNLRRGVVKPSKNPDNGLGIVLLLHANNRVDS